MANKGSKTKLAYGDQETYAASGAFTPIAKVIDINPPNIEADDIDVSHMESPDEHKEFDPGWADGGEVELTIQYEKAKNATVYGLFRQKKGWEMEFSDGSVWGFDGYIKGFGNEVDREGIITLVITIKVSGKPVFEAAA
jgi:hypothetical protein